MTDFIADIIANNGAEFYSEAIDALAYNREDKQLLVEFASGGDYVYGDVEESTFNLLLGAPSVGRFYRAHIQGKYTSLNLNITDIVERESKKNDNVFPIHGVAFPDEIRESRGLRPLDDGTELTVDGGLNAKYGVKWLNGNLHHEAEFQALSEADALVQFQTALNAIGFTGDAKIVSVTHYFD